MDRSPIATDGCAHETLTLFGSQFVLHASEHVVEVRFDLGRAGGAITVSLLAATVRAVFSRAPCWAEYGAADVAGRADILEQRGLPCFVLTLLTCDQRT